MREVKTGKDKGIKAVTSWWEPATINHFLFDRLQAARGLRRTLEKDERLWMQALVAIADEDRATRMEGIGMAVRVMERDKSTVEEVLRKWRDDSDIGHEVKRLLGESLEMAKEENVLLELLSTITITSEDIDCY